MKAPLYFLLAIMTIAVSACGLIEIDIPLTDLPVNINKDIPINQPIPGNSQFEWEFESPNPALGIIDSVSGGWELLDNVTVENITLLIVTPDTQTFDFVDKADLYLIAPDGSKELIGQREGGSNTQSLILQTVEGENSISDLFREENVKFLLQIETGPEGLQDPIEIRVDVNFGMQLAL
ncbi:hypothetical protein [Pontibacter sp. G13]|uniref:hypothetical protein n=1 Tax=Pontibacter sp. G13 TaxID=3074898 RepID=UPI00288B1BEB|nr:hypothetical protein [Pontibacter sp. G13]WNJ17946.1 hypothetical protein RJD25_24085 [Pontibacter sp. G13]